MSTVKEIEAAITKLTPQELEEVREFVEQVAEDQLELSDACKASIQRAEQDIAEGRVRIRTVEVSG
jgi:predicted outer membrane protein